MVIEIRKNHAIVDGHEVDKRAVLRIQEYGTKKNPKKRYSIDFRKSDLREVSKLEVRNKSGHSVVMVGVNDWSCSIKTSQGIKAQNGFMEYMSQYPIE